MSRQKTLKRLKGRLKELEHLDIVEVKWVDAASHGGWSTNKINEEPIEALTLGYLDHVDYGDKKYGDYIVLRGSESETGARALISSIPLTCVVEVRLVSKGKVFRG